VRLLGRVETRRIVATTTAGLVVAAVFLAVVPSWYSATLAVVPSGQGKGPSPLAGAAAALGGVADLAALDLGQSADVERIAAVLQSRSVTDAVIERYDLLERYGKNRIEKARKALWKHCAVRIDRKAKVVSLTCEDKEPGFVQELLRYFGEVGNETFRRVSASAASEEVRFLEQRVAEMKTASDEAAQALRAFEEQYKIVDLEAQSKAVVSTIASLKNKEINKDLELSYVGSFSSSDEVTAQQLRQQLAVIRAKTRALVEAPAAPAPATAAVPDTGPASAPATAATASAAQPRKDRDLFPPALEVPQLRFELEQLYRDRKLLEGNLIFLMQRLETAKVNQARDTSTFVVLDPPALPTYPSWPRRLMVLLLAVALGAAAGVAWSFGPGYVRSLLAPGPAAPGRTRDA
jgi:capsule polysaccharide export protein KpsE/RkpR